MLTKARNWARKIKKNITALYLVLKRKDVHWLKKVYIGLIVSYAISPIDLIPDFIPILGYLDDVIILPLMIVLALKMIPKPIMEECRQEAEVKLKGKRLISLPAGIVIGLIWLSLLAFLIYKLFFTK